MDLTDLVLQRLIKVMDRFKRGYIQKGDFIGFLRGDKQNGDWLTNCK
jgi:hypothetical protein